MHALHADKTVEAEKLSYDSLEKRLNREKKARLAAEALLEQKSLELFQANQEIEAKAFLADKERTMLEAVFDARQAGLILTHADLTIERVNPVARTMLGWQEGNLSSKLLSEFLSGPQATADWIRKRTGESASFDASSVEGVLIHTFGEEIPVRIACTQIGFGDLRLWILNDIRKELAEKAEKQLLEDSLHQAQKLEALGTLASGIAHEINTPIQYVGDNVKFLQEFYEGASDLLAAYEALRAKAESQPKLEEMAQTLLAQREEADIEFLLEEAPEALEQSFHGLKQVATIVAAVREFSHPGVTELTPVDLNAVIDTTLSVSKNSWKHVAEIKADLDPDLPNIQGQPGELHQVILNLVSNATDAIEEKASGEEGLIEIRSRKLANTIEITVKDNGTGIDDACRDRIFDPFFTTKDPGKGTGQGLGIVYKIVQVKHSGTIKIESTQGKGTTFKLRFPIAKQTLEAAE